jgi:hypothetical protein
MSPINKIYLYLDFDLKFKAHPKGECYQLVQLCFLCKNISILFLLEIILTKSTCGLFGLGRLWFSTHRGMCKMYIKDEINFPIVSYPFVCNQGRNSRLYTLYLFFSEVPGTNIFDPIYINYLVIYICAHVSFTCVIVTIVIVFNLFTSWVRLTQFYLVTSIN